MTELTNAALAAAVGITERRVASVKSEGRLPLTPSGKVDGDALLRLGWRAALEAKGVMRLFPEPTEDEIEEAKGLGPALTFTEPMHRGFAMATLLALHEAPISTALAAAVVGVPRAQAERMADYLLAMLLGHLNDHAAKMGMPGQDEVGAIPLTEALWDWRPWVNWQGVYDGEGRSLVTEAAAQPCAQ